MRTFQPKCGLLGYLKGCKVFIFISLQFLPCFSNYNSKLHDICSTSNLVHPPFIYFSNLIGRDVIIIYSSPPEHILNQLEKSARSVSKSSRLFKHVYSVIKSDQLRRCLIIHLKNVLHLTPTLPCIS